MTTPHAATIPPSQSTQHSPSRQPTPSDPGENSMRPLRVTTVAQGWPDDRPGGMNRYVADLHAGFTATGVEDRLVVFGPAAGAPDAVLRAVVETAPLPRRVASLTRQAWRASTGSRRGTGGGSAGELGASDVLASHFALYGTLPAQLLRLRSLLPGRGRVPLVVHFHGPWAQESASQGASSASARAKNALEAAHVRSASAVITASRAFRDLAVDLHGLDPQRVHAIHPGVDLARFSPLPDHERAALRARLGFGEDDVVAVTVRRLVPRMGLDVLLDAWPAAPGRHLVVVGDGPTRPALVAQAEAAGLVGVTFPGRVSDAGLIDAYRAADVVLVPSVALEGFGLVVLEALACGTPVLASDLGGLAEVLPDLGDNLLVPPGDAGAWRARLERALTGDLPGRAACRALAEQHSLEAFATAVAGVHRTACREAR